MNINNTNLCTRCFEQNPEGLGVCAFCGYSDNETGELTTNLPIGTMLMGRFITGKVLGKGGFGITYLAYDLKNDRKVAIKEYMPDNLSYRSPGSSLVSTYSGEKEEFFKQGSEKFYEEAKTISKFNGHPNIINVYEFFYENNTAYFVMEYVEGVDLKSYVMQKGGKIPEEECIRLLLPVMDALIVVHSIGILHRDISPDNIYITKDGNVKLLDFGAARQVLGEKSKSLSVILKQGFAPFEQYQTRGNQGPWTDIYSLAATIYYCLVGKVPEAAMDRINRDDLKTLPMLGEYAQPKMAKVLSKALAIKEASRYRTMSEFKQAVEEMGFAAGNENKTMEVKPASNPASKPVFKNRKRIISIAAAAAILVIACVGFALSQSPPGGSKMAAGSGGLSSNATNAGEASGTVNTSQSTTEPSVVLEEPSENTKAVETQTEAQGENTIALEPETSQSPKATEKAVSTPKPENTVKPASTPKPAAAAATEPPAATAPPAQNDGVTTVTNVNYLFETSALSVKTKYTGQWKDDKPNGQGEMVIAGTSDRYEVGDRITGNFVNGDIHGAAKCKYADGAEYEGNFLNGLRQGKGTLVLTDGKFEGQFDKNLIDGQGTFYFNDGAKYVGEFKHNAIEGKGTKYLKNGDRYEGQFIQGNREGKGTYYFAEGGEYTGDWKNDIREGQGTMTWNTGNKYAGAWKNDKRNGKGTYTWKDGRKYVGDWVDDTIEGQGSYYDMDGNLIKEGKWKNNSFVGE